MRIKFRAKCEHTGKWVYGYFSKDYVGTSYITTLDGISTITVDESTLGQFIGLKDKNNVEIYEGDNIIAIIKSNGYEINSYENAEIIYSKENASFIVSYIFGGVINHVSLVSLRHIEIIGNIYNK